MFPGFFSYILQFDVIFLYETHVTFDNRYLFLNYFRDYDIHFVDALKTQNSGRASGGCLFAMKKMLPNFIH